MQPTNKIKTIQTIHLAFCGAVLVFAITVFTMVSDRVYFDMSFDQDNGLFPLFPIIAFIAIFVGIKLFNKQLADLDYTVNLDSKFAKYQTAFLIRTAFLDAGALMNISAFLITANLVFVVAALFPFFFLLRFRPSKDEVIEVLKLQYPETDQLE
jgi:hypothetical protein